MTSHASAELVAAFTPTGPLRASINLGNPILANAGADGTPHGVSIDLAHAFAERLGAALELVVFRTAGNSVEAVTQERADIGFFAVDPVRGAGIGFTAPYVLIEGCYMVRDASPMTRNDDVDREGNRVVVGAGSAYDLHLTRKLKAATIGRQPARTTLGQPDCGPERAVFVPRIPLEVHPMAPIGAVRAGRVPLRSRPTHARAPRWPDHRGCSRPRAATPAVPRSAAPRCLPRPASCGGSPRR